MHYFSPHYHKVCASDRYDSRQAETLQKLFADGDKFKLAHEETVGSQKYLFTHAGINQPWLKRNIDVIGQLNDYPIITPHYACLDCRSAFVLDESGTIEKWGQK